MVVRKKDTGRAAKAVPIEISSVSQYIAEVVKNAPGRTTIRTYRGHAKASYLLKPSLYRNLSQMKDEKNILRELVSLYPSEFQTDRSAFDQLVRMQHFSLETRLLDVSMKLLVGLYCAIRSNPSEDGHVVALDVDHRSVKYFGSDTDSCIANLSSLSSKERNEIRNFENDNQLNSSQTGKRLLHFIKTEKPYFLPNILISDLSRIYWLNQNKTNVVFLRNKVHFLFLGLTMK